MGAGALARTTPRGPSQPRLAALRRHRWSEAGHWWGCLLLCGDFRLCAADLYSTGRQGGAGHISGSSPSYWSRGSAATRPASCLTTPSTREQLVVARAQRSCAIRQQSTLPPSHPPSPYISADRVEASRSESMPLRGRLGVGESAPWRAQRRRRYAPVGWPQR
jgi:hypothetical protein